MKSIIEELWYGNVVSIDDITTSNLEERELIALRDRNRNKLLEKFTDDEKELFEKYEDVVKELHSYDSKQAFEYGFKLGVRIVVEAVG